MKTHATSRGERVRQRGGERQEGRPMMLGQGTKTAGSDFDSILLRTVLVRIVYREGNIFMEIN